MEILFRTTAPLIGAEYRKVRVGMLVNTGLRALYRLLEPILKAATPVRTGALRGSTKGQILHASGARDQILSVRQEAKTKAGAYYGRFVREGTRPHVIVPRRPGGILAFRVNGEWVFTRRVNHPGTLANPYHLRAMEKARPQIEAIAGRMASDIVAIVTGGKK